MTETVVKVMIKRFRQTGEGKYTWPELQNYLGRKLQGQDWKHTQGARGMPYPDYWETWFKVFPDEAEAAIAETTMNSLIAQFRPKEPNYVIQRHSLEFDLSDMEEEQARQDAKVLPADLSKMLWNEPDGKSHKFLLHVCKARNNGSNMYTWKDLRPWIASELKAGGWLETASKFGLSWTCFEVEGDKSYVRGLAARLMLRIHMFEVGYRQWVYPIFKAEEHRFADKPESVLG